MNNKNYQVPIIKGTEKQLVWTLLTLYGERLCLEYVLQGRSVDDQHLAHQGEQDSQAEGLVREQADGEY